MDLISIYKNEKVNFVRLVKECLRMVAAGKQPHYYIPCNKAIKGEIKSIYQNVLTLDEKKDADIIKYLNGAKFRQVNALIKATVRSCVVAPLFFNCLEHPECYEYTEIPNLMSPPLKYDRKNKKSAIKKENVEKKIVVKNNISDIINSDENIESNENVTNTEKEKISHNNTEEEKPLDDSNDFFNSLQGLLSQF